MSIFSDKKQSVFSSGNLGAITSGEAVLITEVNDEMFSKKMLGDGVAFISNNGLVSSPCDGTISAVFPTNHAVGITCTDGAEILIHIGIDTVKEKGKGFKSYVKQGDVVKRGNKLIKFDRKTLEKKGYDMSVLMILTNMDELEEFKTLHLGDCVLADNVISYKIRNQA